MDKSSLIKNIRLKKSFLCIGLDTDTDKIPTHLKNNNDPVFEFNKSIIDSTKKYAIAYKLNLAFYERHGSKGWQSLEKTVEYLKSEKDIFIIADAKRGDIGNSAKYYAKSFFENLGVNAVTVNPYMGYDTIEPFLEYDDKFTIILAHTSNAGSSDFQRLKCGNSYLYEEVLKKFTTSPAKDRVMFVIGATKPDILLKARELAPSNFFLVPGVGAQGGDLKSVCENGFNNDCGLLINSSRGIIYASSDKDFDNIASNSAMKIKEEMESFLKLKEII